MILSPKNPMRVVLLSVLAFQVLAFGLAIPVMILVSHVPAAQAVVFAGLAAVLALAAAGSLRRPLGYYLGWVAQLAGLALGFLTLSMFLVGLLFAALWVVSFVLGRQLDARAIAAGRPY